MFNFLTFATFNLLNVLLAIFFILLGGVIPLLERKYLSLTHRRVGPKFVGFKGRFQFIADAIKLLVKEFLLPKKTNKFFFFYNPYFFVKFKLIFSF